MITRRVLVAAAAGAAIARAAPPSWEARPLGAEVTPSSEDTVFVQFDVAQRRTPLPCFGGAAVPMWTYTEGRWPPVIRMNLGSELDVVLRNSLDVPNEHTSIHWHGIRLPNDQDGVPYLVQRPVWPGESFRYRFAPPDAGTFFFHSHCDSVQQMGRGLQGVLIVDGDVTQPYDADVLLLVRDWRLARGAGDFDAFTSPRYAARAGTYGPLRSTNGQSDPLIELPAAGDCRLRLLNTDVTRVMRLRFDRMDAAVVAIDGNPVAPFEFGEWLLAPGKRCDVIVRAPSTGRRAHLVDASVEPPVELARFVGAGPPVRRPEFDPAPLRAARIAPPDLAHARRLEFRFDSTNPSKAVGTGGGAGPAALGDLCLSSGNFWTINEQPWPQRRGSVLPAPIAVLQRGATYVLALRNESDFTHPIHVHGHTLTVLHSTKQDLPPHHADTVLLLPGEEAEAAFVADNPGDWMLHCHVIEHQENGMMAYLRVE